MYQIGSNICPMTPELLFSLKWYKRSYIFFSLSLATREYSGKYQIHMLRIVHLEVGFDDSIIPYILPGKLNRHKRF